VQQATHPTYRIWCPLHQLDLNMKSGMNNIQDGQFYKETHAFSVYLRAQHILIAEMGTTYPRDTNHWTHVMAMLSWMLKHRVRLFQRIEEKHPHQAPSTMWWIIASGIIPVGEEINKLFVKLQGNLLVLSQQREMIANTITSIISMWNIHKIAAEPPDSYDAQLYYINADWWVEFDTVTDCIAEHGGSFSRDRFEELDVNEQQLVHHEIADYVVDLVANMLQIIAEHDSNNLASIKEAPPVMPGEIASMSHRQFMKDVLDLLRVWLKESGWTEIEIDQAEQDYHDYRYAYMNEPLLKSKIDNLAVAIDFNVAWNVVDDRFMDMRAMFTGLATVFHNSTSVEGDFSIAKWERDPIRLFLANLSLEGIFQCKQTELFHSILV
jgi:hypothetical protein